MCCQSCEEGRRLLGKALCSADESSCPPPRDGLGFTTQAAFRAPNLPPMVNLGKASSSALGALAPGRWSNLGLGGSNRTGNWSRKGDEVTLEEVAGTPVLHVLQREFQPRL